MSTILPDPVAVASDPNPAADTAFRTYLAQSRFGSLDGLRCLCILAVIWHHGPWWTSMTDGPRILERGFVGVDFFFVLSGFLITTLLLREARKTGGFSLAGFYWRRALRILPVYYFVVTLVALYYIVIKGEHDYLVQLPYYYLFLSNFLTDHIPMLDPTWSLSVEEQYYLIWPLALLILPAGWVLPAVGLLVAVNLIGIMGVFGMTGPELGPLRIALPPATYAPILIGSALALILNRREGFAAAWPVLGHRAAAPVAFLLIVLLLQLLPPDLRGLPNLALHLAMAAALATLVLREDNLMAPALRWHPVARMGEISYGIYLYHLIALHIAGVAVVKIGMVSAPLVLIGYAGLSFIMADLSDRTLERYFRQFRTRGPGAAS